MSDFKNVMKGGWHPKGKDGGKESWRGDFKGINQVAGWMGKGKKPGDGQGSEHISRPLATLKDPSSFGPPPRNVNYHGGAALPNETTPHTGGLGAPLTQAEIEKANREVQRPSQEEIEEEKKPQGPALPYRADRTGLQTSHLPPPPVHRNIASLPQEEASQPVKPKPGLPPRLPSRQNSAGITSPTSPPPPAYDGVASPPQPATSTNSGLNTSAINRLGNAGISVPGLGIGKNASSTNGASNPWSNEQSQNAGSAQPATKTFSELSNRFARMNSNSFTTAATAPTTAEAQSQTQSPPAQPTSPPTWQQSQSALRTASNFHKDPSSVSIADAQNAAQTANSGVRSANAFRDKHADTFAAAGRRANAFDQRYKVKSRFENFLDKHAPIEEQGQQQGAPGTQPAQSPGVGIQPSASPELAASISRKPPPPPPPKKPSGLHGNANSAPAPPVPMSTKPTF